MATREMGVRAALAKASAAETAEKVEIAKTESAPTNTFSNPGLSGRKLSNDVIKERRQQYLNSLPPKPGQKVFF